MKGELWEPCEVCGTEPVCSSCQGCKRHCSCYEPPVTGKVFDTAPG